MPEILTESFCERCGTRYTFESAAPKGARLKGFKTVSRGLRNFVMSDDTSMDEAMAAARNETDREATSQQLDAFHKTFNFCMSCRQYTCSNCWNEVEGRCLSCAPSLGTEVLPAPFPNLDTSLPFGSTGLIGDTENGHDHTEAPASEPMSWPTSDLMRDEEAAPADFEDLLARREAETAIEDDDSFDPLARLAALDAELTPPAEAASEPAAEGVEDEPAVAGVEPATKETPVEPEPEPVATAEPEPEPIAVDQQEPEPVAAAEPEPVAPVASGSEPVADRDDRAAAAAAQTSDLLNRFRPGQSLDDAIAAYELTQTAADVLAEPAPTEPEPEPESVAAAPEPEPEPEPVAAAPEPAPEPEPVAAAPEPEPAWPAITPSEPEPAPLAASAPPEPISIGPSEPDRDRIAASSEFPWAVDREPEPTTSEPVAADPRTDVVPQPTWQIMAPDTTEEPQWPAPPAWPGAGPSEGLPFLGRPAQPTGGIDALWAESAREVASAEPAAAAASVNPLVRPAGGIQPCVSCGLSLSANARFCRRCGTRQG